MSGYVLAFLGSACSATAGVAAEDVEALARALVRVRDDGGRLFVLGVGGSAANASHAVNDFRKLCGIETYAPTDNVAELSARTNDEGWEVTFAAWLEVSRLGARDAVLVLSVGGGNPERRVSMNIVRALELASARGATVLGIVGRDGGQTARTAEVAVIIPTVDAGLVTPLAESLQSLILHCLVSHPDLQRGSARWEGLDAGVPTR